MHFPIEHVDFPASHFFSFREAVVYPLQNPPLHLCKGALFENKAPRTWRGRPTQIERKGCGPP